MSIQVVFDKGTLVLTDVPEAYQAVIPQLVEDPRANCWRTPASAYREVITFLHKNQIPYEDKAKDYQVMDNLALARDLVPRPYQEAALAAWVKQRSRGVVILPTGSGKTILAVLAIEHVKRPTLIHVPTIDLMHQWHDVLQGFFGCEIGRFGGGLNELHAITVTTYDSGLLHMSSKGNRFGLTIFDECHRLPTPQYRHLVDSSIAPFRLGLTATPERSDGKESLLYELLGACCYRSFIHDMAGSTLAEYRVETIEVPMSQEERDLYNEENRIYLEFLRDEKINMGHPRGWHNFLYRCSLSQEGRRAFKAWKNQKRLAQAASAKENWVWDLIQAHRHDRIIVFTQDNAMAYRLGERFILPVITHKTPAKERVQFLTLFREGTYRVLLTSKVLNEGVDVPDANVAIVVSGSGAVREHVQRLGRILRQAPGKTAVLYELVSEDTRETYVNRRRRQHHAYQGSGSFQNS